MKPSLIILAIMFPVALLAQPRSPFDQWDKNKDGKLVEEELPAQLRKNFSRVDRNGDGFISREEDAAFRNRGGGPRQPSLPDGIEKIADLDYSGNDNPRQKLDLYLPRERREDAEPLPLIAFIHGGGWKNGDKASGWNKLREFIPEGNYAGASIGYRLTDEAQWPSQIHDCKAAIRWLRANASEHGIDPNRIAVWGSSAGGHLVAMLGVSHEVEGLEGQIGDHLETSSEVSCVVNFFGPSELLTMDDHPGRMTHNAPDSPESKLVGGPIQKNKEKAENASPITWVSSDDEPSLIVHGTEDQLVPYPQSVDLEAALEKEGVKTILLTVDGGGHGQGFGPAVTDAVRTFLDHQLRGAEKTIKDGTVKAGE
ncbi:MAG: alpha/beta hydrolase [Verrucomicrobiota bacterium]